jgi:short-chain fatty acids transporter
MNLMVGLALLVVLPLAMWWTAKKSPAKHIALKKIVARKDHPVVASSTSGAEKMDYSRLFSLLLGMVFLGTSVYLAVKAGNFSFVNLNYINFALFALGILLTPNVTVFQQFVTKSIQAASGILIQFPLYAGIMGLMKYSGLFLVFTQAFVHFSTVVTLPVYTLLSAGLVNFFVPSGGGQWAVQGPVIVEAAKQLGVSVPKIIMALAYGDQWTNMLQPFWALPLLGITGLKAKEIVPYTFLLFLCGGVIFVMGLLFF